MVHRQRPGHFVSRRRDALLGCFLTQRQSLLCQMQRSECMPAFEVTAQRVSVSVLRVCVPCLAPDWPRPASGSSITRLHSGSVTSTVTMHIGPGSDEMMILVFTCSNFFFVKRPFHYLVIFTPKYFLNFFYRSIDTGFTSCNKIQQGNKILNKITRCEIKHHCRLHELD